MKPQYVVVKRYQVVQERNFISVGEPFNFEADAEKFARQLETAYERGLADTQVVGQKNRLENQNKLDNQGQV